MTMQQNSSSNLYFKSESMNESPDLKTVDNITYLKKQSIPATFQMAKSQTVQNHPLTRSSSGSSNSSLEFESSTTAISENENNLTSNRKSRSGRFHDFIAKYDDPSKQETDEQHPYYNSASVLWHNRAKIFTNLKKQATDSVRSLTQSTSLDTGSNKGLLYKSLEESVDVQQTYDEKGTMSRSSSHSGLIKVETEKIVENQEDQAASSFLHGLKETISDPLQELEKREDETALENELLDMSSTGDYSMRFRSHTTPTVSGVKPSKEVLVSPSKTWKSSDISNKSSLSVSLSGLMAGKSTSVEDDLAEYTSSCDDAVLSRSADDTILLNEALSSKKSALTSSSLEEEKLPEDSTDDDFTSFFTILFLSAFVYIYCMLPIPPVVQTVVSSFIFGCLFTSAYLCIVAPRPRRLQSFLPSPVESHVSRQTSKQLYDPDQPIKGWMNELFCYEYDPETYHISNTQSVYITLDGATMRLQTPLKSIPRRSVHNEGNIPISKVVEQRLFDITFAKVNLKPPGLVKKRVWSKKYPICVEIPCENPSDDAQTNKGEKLDERTEIDDKTEQKSSKDVKCIHLFGRTDRQKEEWFYRIQRSINIALSKHKKALKLAQKRNSVSHTPSLNIEDDWGVIEDHYEEETFVASSTLDVTKMLNEEPLRAFQDYYIHVSRLMPEANKVKTESQKHVSPVDSQEEEEEHSTEVAWLNVVLGRVLFDFLRQPVWAKWLSVKIQKKLDKIKLPYFIDELKLTEMDLGSSVPLVHQISLPRLNSQGIWIDMDITYSGSMQMTLKTKLILTKLGKNEVNLVEKERVKQSSATTDSDAEDSAESSDDEESAVSRIVGQVQTAVMSKVEGQYHRPQLANQGPSNPPAGGAPPKKWVRIVDSITKSKYFQKATETEYIRKKLETVSNTPMLLTVELLELKGTVVVNIPPPPTDRIWYGFKEPPMMMMKAHPKVGERVVKTTHVTDWIENKLQQEFTKVLVVPNMDDIPVPVMYNNRPPS